MFAALKRNASSFLRRRKRLSPYSASRQASSIYVENPASDNSPMIEGSPYMPHLHPLNHRVFDGSSFVDESVISSLSLSRLASHDSPTVPGHLGMSIESEEKGKKPHSGREASMTRTVKAGIRLDSITWEGSQHRALILDTHAFAQIQAISRLYRDLRRLESRIVAAWSESESLLFGQRALDDQAIMELPGTFPAEMALGDEERHRMLSHTLQRKLRVSTKALQDLRAQKSAVSKELDRLQADITELLGQALDGADAMDSADANFELHPSPAA